MINKLKNTAAGLIILVAVYLTAITLFAEYCLSRDMPMMVVLVSTFGAMVYTYQMLKLISNFIHQKIKEND